ncbi:uncharacterized protein OCT59_011777 [Rhizophagus irregularis]|uniref:uncharacterized protein n=1 Tax=Rhizophagus irregularis TaxID=588596 RepID=UPI0033246480|nr:hypothetical protein OCT59_011777 [Rhizophagus irregularis]
MGVFMLNDDVFEQIKDFNHKYLTKEQSLLIDKLILNKELKIRYKEKGLCKECKQPRASYYWCQYITSDFLREIETHIMIPVDSYIAHCFGITKDPESGNFIIVMNYVINGSLRQHLNNSFNSIKWGEKLDILKDLSVNLKYIHENGICQGLRPKSNYKIPQLILNIIKQCWDADPLKRPKAKELKSLLYNLWGESLTFSGETEIKNQIVEADEINEKLTSSSSLYTGPTLSYTTNPQAVYTTRLLDFKNLPEPKNDIDNKDDDNSFGEYSESIEAIDFTKLDLVTELKKGKVSLV